MCVPKLKLDVLMVAVPPATAAGFPTFLPSTGWLCRSGVAVDHGVMCDQYLRARGAADVYAIGDVARFPHPGMRCTVRSEHWTNAVDQARYVAEVVVAAQAQQPGAYPQQTPTAYPPQQQQEVAPSAQAQPYAAYHDPQQYQQYQQ